MRSSSNSRWRSWERPSASNRILNGLPGTSALEKLINGLAAVALLGCVAGVLIGAAQWALGSRSNNYSHASDGKSKVLYGLLGAFVVGAAAAIINFFYSSGTAVH